MKFSTIGDTKSKDVWIFKLNQIMCNINIDNNKS